MACTKAPKLPSSGTHPDSIPLKYKMVTPSSFELSALLSSGRASDYVMAFVSSIETEDGTFTSCLRSSTRY